MGKAEQFKIKYLKEKKRPEVLQEIKPICEAFNIEYDYVIGKYDTFSETLILNGQEIMCCMNSISAVKDEVIGYIFVKHYDRWWHFKPHTKKFIKQYWKENSNEQS